MKSNIFKTVSLLLLLLFMAQSCKKDTEPASLMSCSESYILFGHFYGECLGEECIEIFRICENKLFEDSNDQYPSAQGEGYNGNFQELIKLVCKCPFFVYTSAIFRLMATAMASRPLSGSLAQMSTGHLPFGVAHSCLNKK